jgi:hypothetical protein
MSLISGLEDWQTGSWYPKISGALNPFVREVAWRSRDEDQRKQKSSNGNHVPHITLLTL